MNEKKTILIKVSAGAGVSREIFISLENTLYDLAKAIVYFFGIYGTGDTHVFYMDNRYFSSKDAYALIKNPLVKLSSKYAVIGELDLKQDQKFKFTCGNQSQCSIQCEVKAFSYDSIIKPFVRDSKGSISKYYDGVDTLIKYPLIFSTETIKKLYEKINANKSLVELVKNYVLASANFYGSVLVDYVFGLIKLHNPLLNIDIEIYSKIIDIMFHEESSYYIMNEECLLTKSYENKSYIIDKKTLFICDNLESLTVSYNDYKYKQIEKKELFEYLVSWYVPKEKYNEMFKNFCKNTLKIGDVEAYSLSFDFFNLLSDRYDFEKFVKMLKEENDIKGFDCDEFRDLYNYILDDIPNKMNRGFSNNEIKEMNKIVEPIVYDKIGRNSKCPCGSGKKYKYCCGI